MTSAWTRIETELDSQTRSLGRDVEAAARKSSIPPELTAAMASASGYMVGLEVGLALAATDAAAARRLAGFLEHEVQQNDAAALAEMQANVRRWLTALRSDA